jgi:formate--tetrahydrofolate ligase
MIKHPVPSDIEIAQSAQLLKISKVAVDKLGLTENQIEPYGHTKAKIVNVTSNSKIQGKLILVTAISPTPAGEGKTTTTVGLGDALNLIGKKTLICLREPSIGPVFGMKGGAAGGGYAQVVPMEDINLHFTGDFGAIQLANNLLAAMIDNHIHHGNSLKFDQRRITWRRVLDMNDRALRSITQSLGGPANGYPREDGFDIVVASEVMAILCLADSLENLKTRLGNIVCGYTADLKPILAQDLKAHGAMTVLLKDAIKPNLVQTLENNPALLHGGPFANIAHGCNSVIATRMALGLADYVVTEAGFGADLGAEKFIDIKCRKSGLKPSLAVLVATIRAIKYHGGVEVADLKNENLKAVELGFENLKKHVHNIKNEYGLPCVVSLNRFVSDTPAEIELLKKLTSALDTPLVIAEHWAKGGKGAENLAQAVVQELESPKQKSNFKFVYEETDPLWEKIKKVATKIYGAKEISASSKVQAQLEKFQQDGYGHFPICIAKTQSSFSTDPTLRGAPAGHTVNIRELRLMAGAEFIVAICGDIMTMPGLPKVPSAEKIDINSDGQVIGLF